MLTARAVAEKLDCSVQQVYKLIADGELQAVKIGKRGVRVTLPAFDRFVRRGGCRSTKTPEGATPLTSVPRADAFFAAAQRVQLRPKRPRTKPSLELISGTKD